MTFSYSIKKRAKNKLGNTVLGICFWCYFFEINQTLLDKPKSDILELKKELIKLIYGYLGL